MQQHPNIEAFEQFKVQTILSKFRQTYQNTIYPQYSHTSQFIKTPKIKHNALCLSRYDAGYDSQQWLPGFDTSIFKEIRDFNTPVRLVLDEREEGSPSVLDRSKGQGRPTKEVNTLKDSASNQEN